MARTKYSRNLKTKLKEAKFLTRAVEEEKWRLQRKKPLDVSLRAHIGKLLDSINPMELIAVLGTTYILKQGIEWSEDRLANVTNVIDKVRELTKPPYPTIGPSTTPPWSANGGQWEPLIKSALDLPEVELMEWLLSFTAAYLLVHNFGTIVESGASLLKSGMNLLGTFAVGAVGA